MAHLVYKLSDVMNCRVCGMRQDDPPWGFSQEDPAYLICPCCGVEFGYEDCTSAGINQYRDRWLAGGAEWFEPKCKPVDWDLETQLEGIPARFR